MIEDSSSGNRVLDAYIPIWIALVAVTLYLITLQPVIGWGLSADVARHSLELNGSGEPVYYPLRLLLGYGAGVISNLFSSVPHDLVQNGLSALFGGASLAILFLICIRLGWNRASAVFTCITLGLSHMFWHLSVTSGPYPVSMFLLLLVIYATMRWIDADLRVGAWWLGTAALLAGLGTGETLFFVLLLPGFVVLFCTSDRALKVWWYPVPFVVFLLVGFGISLIVRTLMSGGLNGTELIPVAPGVVDRMFTMERLFPDLLSFGTLLLYQFPLFGTLLGAFGLLVQWSRSRPIRWVLIFPVLLSIPLYSSVLPDQTYYVSLFTFVIFAIWIGEGIGWFLRFASLRRASMDSSYPSILLAVGTVMCLSPLLLYASTGDLEEQPVLTYLIPDRSFPRMDAASYYLTPWKVNQDGSKQLWKDTRKIPDGSILIADRQAAAPIRYYMERSGTSGQITIQHPELPPFRTDPVNTVRTWLRDRSSHEGNKNEIPRTGVYSLNSHPMYHHDLLKKSFNLDHPLFMKKDKVSSGPRTSSRRVRALTPLERSPIWRIRFSSGG